MKKWLIIGILVLVVLYLISGYNGLVSIDETVKQSWAQVQNVYQRRMDLIPNLVETVKGFAKQEQAVFIGVTEARAKATQITVDEKVLNNPELLQKYQAAQGEISSALARLLAVVENYPQLKSDANFRALQDELAGTENRIAVERKRFTETVQQYNVKVRSFPINLIAGIFGFGKKATFEAETAAQKAPEVKF